MTLRILVAGGAGVIGRRLIPLLRQAGQQVAAITRSPQKAALLRELGAEPYVVDVYDAGRLADVVAAVRPQAVIHQLTDLPKDLDPAQMGAAIRRNARVRDEGTRNLVRAAIAAGVEHLVAQSIAWVYRAGPEPHAEDDPLDLDADGDRGITVAGVAALERAVLFSPPLDGAVLRYGQLYGPGTINDGPSGNVPVHVDAAASAALLAVEKRATGIFNIADPNAYAATDKARAELSWSADFRLPAS